MTKWYYFGARYYESAIGRWHSTDALSDLFPNHSTYNYVYNNPINFIDPFALSPENDDDFK